jgi:hypothetical protein
MKMNDDAPSNGVGWCYNFFYKHTNLNSKLKEIGRSQLAEELQETWRLSSLECEQQNFVSTSDKFSKPTMFIPIHITNLSPNHVFWNLHK